MIQNRIERWAGLEEASEEHDGVFGRTGIDALFWTKPRTSRTCGRSIGVQRSF